MEEENKPWIEKRFDTWEINTTGGTEYRICTSANVKIEIDKLYGPLAAYPCRVYLQYDSESPGEWVVEYQNPKTELWEEKARWNCQENWPEDKP